MDNLKNIVLKQIILSAEKIRNEKGVLEGINIKFSPISSNHIYLTSTKRVVNYFPTEIETDGINFDLKSFYDLMLGLSNSISTFMYELRKPINSGEMNLISYSKLEKNKFFKIHVTNHFFRSGNLGKDKVSISIFEDDEDFGENELINIPFTKRDVILLYALFKEILSSELRTKSFFTEASKIDYYTQEEISKETISITKVDNAIVIDSVWLHGQELLNLMYVVDRLLYGFKIEQNLNSLIFNYRQISIEIDNNIPYLIIKKMNDNEEEIVKTDSNGNEYYLKVPLAGYILTILGLYIDIKVLRHADIEHELESNTENIRSKSVFIKNKKIKYHISTKESFIGIGVTKNNKSNYSSLTLSAMVKDNVYKIVDEDVGVVLDSMYYSNGVKKQILTDFSINLKEHGYKLIKGLSIAYTQDYKKWKKNRNMTKFFVTVNEPGGWVKYEVDISSNIKNNVPAILTVSKYKMIKGEDPEFIASFRQPLYHKYIYQLLTMLLAMSEFFPKQKHIIQIDKKELLKYKYKSMKTVTTLKNTEIINYGFKRKNNNLIWGIFSDTNNMKEHIDDSDKFLLKISSEKRLFSGDWVPFVGNKISIGPDRYLTDQYGEINLEKEYGFGVEWATHIYFATSEINPLYTIEEEEYTYD